MIHFTLALIELAGLLVSALLWAALPPFLLAAMVIGALLLARRRR